MDATGKNLVVVSNTSPLTNQLNADLILLDERAGRRAAEYLGLSVMGVVGLLVRARQLNLIPTLRPLLEALQYQAGFYLSQSLAMHALHLVGESQEPP